MNPRTYRAILTLIVCLAVSGDIGIEALGQQWTNRPAVCIGEADFGTRDSVSLKLLAASDEAEVKKEPQPAAPQDREASQSGEQGSAGAKEASEIQKLKEQIIDLQNKGKLGFRKVVLCNSIDGFGLYSPFEPGRPL